MPADTPEDEWGAVYRVHAEDVRAGAASVLRCPTGQDGVVSEVFHRLLRTGESPPDENGKRYFYRAGRNAALNRIRRKEREIVDPGPVLGALSTATSAQPDSVLDRMEKRRALQRAIAGLTPRRREVAELCLLEGWTCREAAKRLGISVKRVQKLRSKAIADLRAILDGGGQQTA